MKKIFWTSIFWIALIFLAWAYARLFNSNFGQSVANIISSCETIPAVTTGAVVTPDLTAVNSKLDDMQTKLDTIIQSLQTPNIPTATSSVLPSPMTK